MGLNLETLIGILVILIVIIFFDGVRRVIRDRNNRLGMKIDPRYKGIGEEWDESEDSNPELPSGGARPASADQPGPDDVPVMMEAAEAAPATRRSLPEDQQDLFGEDSLSASPQQPQNIDDDLPSFSAGESSSVTVNEPAAASQDATRSIPSPEPLVAEEPESAASISEPETSVDPQPESSIEQPQHTEPVAISQPSASSEEVLQAKPDQEQQASPAQDMMEVIVAHVMAPRGQPFHGRELLQCLLEQGMRYGEMNIFHCHKEEAGKNRLQFSMANAVNPGTFDLEEMSDSSYPGVTFFLKLPGPTEPLQALDKMMSVCKAIAIEFSGEVRDEQQSVLTPQTVEHFRNRVQDFERRLRLGQ